MAKISDNILFANKNKTGGGGGGGLEGGINPISQPNLFLTSLIFGQMPVPAVECKRNHSSQKISAKTLYMCSECVCFQTGFFSVCLDPGWRGPGAV